MADWCSSHFICLFVQTHICLRTVVGSQLELAFRAVNGRLWQKLINAIRKICRNTQQTNNKHHFTSCHWQLEAFALFILPHKRLYMIMQPLTSNSVRARPVRPRATVAFAWHTCVIVGSLPWMFFFPHIFSFSISPPFQHHRTFRVTFYTWAGTKHARSVDVLSKVYSVYAGKSLEN